MERTKMPASINDYTKQYGENLHSSTTATRTPFGTWNCLITVEILKDQHGTKRMDHISCSNHISRGIQHINLPWIYLPTFNGYANKINKEL
jgi:hypothetical protein